MFQEQLQMEGMVDRVPTKKALSVVNARKLAVIYGNILQTANENNVSDANINTAQEALSYCRWVILKNK
jgi:hypothetical protein